MAGTRTEAACLRAALAEPSTHREHDASYSLDRHVAEARREMGPEKWARLNKEWEQ